MFAIIIRIIMLNAVEPSTNRTVRLGGRAPLEQPLEPAQVSGCWWTRGWVLVDSSAFLNRVLDRVCVVVYIRITGCIIAFIGTF